MLSLIPCWNIVALLMVIVPVLLPLKRLTSTAAPFTACRISPGPCNVSDPFCPVPVATNSPALLKVFPLRLNVGLSFSTVNCCAPLPACAVTVYPAEPRLKVGNCPADPNDQLLPSE